MPIRKEIVVIPGTEERCGKDPILFFPRFGSTCIKRSESSDIYHRANNLPKLFKFLRTFFIIFDNEILVTNLKAYMENVLYPKPI